MDWLKLPDKLLRGLYLAPLFYIVLTLPIMSYGDDFSRNSEYAVGLTHAKLETTPSGQVMFSVPLEVPPGIRGLAPKVSINYSSDAPNGLAGLGGSVSGFSAITRCGNTIVNDGFNRGVQGDSGDQFCMGGQRLILIQGTHGATGAIYHTEIESFQRIRIRSSLTGPDGDHSPQSFVLNNPGGGLMEYGKDATSRLASPQSNVVHAWWVSHVEDVHGNEMDYRYHHNAGVGLDGQSALELLPLSIHYGGNRNQGVSHHLSVHIDYEDRPDSRYSFRHGTGFKQSQRVSSIRTMAGNTLVRRYVIGYDESEFSYQSRMKNLQECAGDGSCFPPTQLTWATPEFGFEVDHTWAPPAAMVDANGGMRGAMVDINGDGRTDWIIAIRNEQGQDSLAAYLNQPDGWQQDYNYTPPAALSHVVQVNGESMYVNTGEVVDLNGDGRPDWISAYKNGNGVTRTTWLNTGTGWAASTNFRLPDVISEFSAFPESRAQLIDINADGLVDVIVSTISGSGLTTKNTWLNTGSGWTASTSHRLPGIQFDYQNNLQKGAQGQFADVNGDGWADWLIAIESANGSVTRQTWLNSRAGFSLSSGYRLPGVVASFKDRADGIMVGQFSDLNGDGLPDYVHGVENEEADPETHSQAVWLNTGVGWRSSADYRLPYFTTEHDDGGTEQKGVLADVDGNGLVEHLRTYRNENGRDKDDAWRNTGSGWVLDGALELPVSLFETAGTTSGKNSLPLALFTDINADGVADLVRATAGKPWEVLINRKGVQEFAHPEVVTETKSAFGSVSRAVFKPGSVDSLYTRRTGAIFPVIDIPVIGPLVATMEASDGIGGLVRSHHRYGGLRMHSQGRGSLGFTWQQVVDERTGIVLHARYNQTFPYVGQQLETIQALDGKPISNVVQTDGMKSLFGGKTVWPFTDTKITKSFALDGSLISIAESRTQFDDFGRLTQVASEIDDQSRVFSKIITNQYGNNELANWKIGKVTKSVTTDSAPGTSDITRELNFSYNNDLQLVSRISDPAHSHALTTAYEYDGFGNAVKTTISANGITSRSKRISMSNDGRFPLTTTNAKGHTASAEYDGRFGVITRKTNSNGLVKIISYDAFGKKKRELTEREHELDANEVVLIKWCENTCPANGVYFVGAATDQGDAPEAAYFDSLGREIRKQSHGFDSVPVVQDNEYYATGKIARKSRLYYQDAQDNGRVWVTYEYDVLGRKIKTTAPDGGVTRFTYNGLTTIVTNPLFQTHTTEVNGQGKPILVKDHENNVVRYTYDAVGRLLTTQDPLLNTITNTYDLLGRKTRMVDPDMGTWRYQYDALGQMSSQTDGNGKTTTMVYDLLGRQTQKTTATGIAEAESSTWTFDTADNGIGRLASVTHGANYQRSHDYDDLGRPVKEDTTIDGDTYTLARHFKGSLDEVDAITYPNGMLVRTLFNDYGHATEVRSEGLNTYQAYKAAFDHAQDLIHAYEVHRTSVIDEREVLIARYKAITGDASALEKDASYWAGKIKSAVKKQKSYISRAEAYNRKIVNIGNRGGEIIKEVEALEKKYEAALARQCGGPGRGGGDTPQKAAYLKCVKEKSHALRTIPKRLTALGSESKSLLKQSAEATAEVERAVSNANAYGKAAKRASGRYQNYYNQLKNVSRRAKPIADQIKAIDDVLKRKYDAGQAAIDAAEELEELYKNDSELHWKAESYAADGQITRFRQGNDVITEVGYNHNTGQVTQVKAILDNKILSTLQGDTLEKTLVSLTNLIGQIKSDIASYTRQIATDKAELNNILAQIDADQKKLDLINENTPDGEALLLQIANNTADEAIEGIDIAFNEAMKSLLESTLTRAESLHGQYSSASGLLKASQLAEGYQQILAYYHGQINAAYQAMLTAHAQMLNDNKAFIANNQPGYQREQDELAAAKSVIDGYVAQSASLQKRYDAKRSEYNKYAAEHSSYSKRYKSIYRYARRDHSRALHFKRRGDNHRYNAYMKKANKFYSLAKKLKSKRNTANRNRTNAYNAMRLINTSLAAIRSKVRDTNEIIAINEESLKKYTSLAHIARQYAFAETFAGHSKLAAKADSEAKRLLSTRRHLKLAGKQGEIQHETYLFGLLGNLVSRTDIAQDLEETFSYDSLNRLVSSRLTGSGADLYQFANLDTTTYGYDVLGNITHKSDVGDYTYSANGAGPHAVTGVSGTKNASYTYDANGNMLSGDGRTIVFGAHNKPISITNNNATTRMDYGPEGQLIKQVVSGGANPMTQVWAGGIYEKITSGADTEHRYHIPVKGGITAVIHDKVTASGGDITVNYLHRDYLDSIVAVSDRFGLLVERFNYEAFGKRRTAIVAEPKGINLITVDATDRGFTGHRHLASAGLIHMNGRVYDPTLARFISADPHIQSPGNLQSFNRYSYTLNNPLAYTDPSGYLFGFLKNLFKGILKAFKKIMTAIVNTIKKIVKFIKDNIRTIAAIAVAVAMPYALPALGPIMTGMIAGAASGLVATGSLKGMLIGGLTGAALAGIGQAVARTASANINAARNGLYNGANMMKSGLTHAQFAGKILAHGVVGGTRSVLSGGKFGTGFLSGGVAAAATPVISKIENPLVGTAAAGMVGGATSELAGGEFKEGFLTGAYGYALNHLSQGWHKNRQMQNAQKGHSWSGDFNGDPAHNYANATGQMDAQAFENEGVYVGVGDTSSRLTYDGFNTEISPLTYFYYTTAQDTFSIFSETEITPEISARAVRVFAYTIDAMGPGIAYKSLWGIGAGFAIGAGTTIVTGTGIAPSDGTSGNAYP